MKTKIIFTIIMALSFVGNVCVAAVDSNSKILDGIEYYVQTDKSVYELGENVEMLYRITNLSDQDVTFTLGQSPVWNFWAERDGTQIWQGVNGWWEVITQFTLAPGEHQEFPHQDVPFIWDLHNDNGELVDVGNYDIIGGLYGNSSYDYTKVSVPIEITPEPATILLLAMGILGIRTNKHKS